MTESTAVQRRNYLPTEAKLDSWQDVAPYFEELKSRTLNSREEVEQFLKDQSELESFVSENLGWRYIRMTTDTANEAFAKSYSFFVNEIQPALSREFHALNEKLYKAAGLPLLDEERYRIFLRNLNKEIELFRPENIKLEARDQTLAQEYGAISGAMGISWKGEKITMQKAARLLQSTRRNEREEAFEKIAATRLQYRDQIDGILDKMVGIRTEIAKNAGFDSYRDYKFRSLGRFDYSVADCENFHQSIKNVVMPLVEAQAIERKKKLGVAALKPWDLAVDPEGREPLSPFSSAPELLRATEKVFGRLDPYFAFCLNRMQQLNHLDLESRAGKAPGGYNYPLYETGAPFIFMNAVGSHRDVVTMVHEGGHAVHSFLSDHLELVAFKGLTSEIAELASMSMELLSMDMWDEFYTDPAELKRAKIDHLEDIIGVFPWIAKIDKFQHWLYTHPGHNAQQRAAYWLELSARFDEAVTDWTGLESFREISWQKQLHIFEVPFYYIEYAMAQLGALAVWRNYKLQGQKAIDQYKEALSLGYSKTIGEVYEAAGIRFDFSEEYVRELVEFLQEEINRLKSEA